MVKSTVIEAPQCGYYYEAEYASDFANLIMQFCQNSEKQQMATNSYDYYCKHYSKERFLAVLEETLIKMEV